MPKEQSRYGKLCSFAHDAEGFLDWMDDLKRERTDWPLITKLREYSNCSGVPMPTLRLILKAEQVLEL